MSKCNLARKNRQLMPKTMIMSERKHVYNVYYILIHYSASRPATPAPKRLSKKLQSFKSLANTKSTEASRNQEAG